MSATGLRGLYAITSSELCRDPRRLFTAVEAALRGGARLVQYRDKAAGAQARRANALELLALCRARDSRLVINDDVELAGTIGAGVHIGASDLPLRETRRRLGRDAIIGVSCANQLVRALEAQHDGASYVAFGRFFPSRTKPDAPQAELSLLGQARARLHVPICAIGGVTPDNAPQLINAGADLIAAVEGVFAAPDIAAAAGSYARLFDQ